MRDWRYMMMKEGIKLRDRALVYGACLMVLMWALGANS